MLVEMTTIGIHVPLCDNEPDIYDFSGRAERGRKFLSFFREKMSQMRQIGLSKNKQTVEKL